MFSKVFQDIFGADKFSLNALASIMEMDKGTAKTGHEFGAKLCLGDDEVEVGEVCEGRFCEVDISGVCNGPGIGNIHTHPNGSPSKLSFGDMLIALEQSKGDEPKVQCVIGDSESGERELMCAMVEWLPTKDKMAKLSKFNEGPAKEFYDEWKRTGEEPSNGNRDALGKMRQKVSHAFIEVENIFLESLPYLISDNARQKCMDIDDEAEMVDFYLTEKPTNCEHLSKFALLVRNRIEYAEESVKPTEKYGKRVVKCKMPKSKEAIKKIRKLCPGHSP